jgi:hypothetical protein
MELSGCKSYDWGQRYGQTNQHNGRRLQILRKGGIENTMEIASRATTPETDSTRRRQQSIGEMVEGAIEKKRRFGIPAPELDELEGDLKQRMPTSQAGEEPAFFS